MAIRTLCIRPDDYEDTKLFVPCSTYEDVCGALTSFLDNKGFKRRRLLVHGERGIGKSICVRAAISELEQEREDFFPIIVPGDRCTTVKTSSARSVKSWLDRPASTSPVTRTC